MAEFTYNPVQSVDANQNVILNNSISCTCGKVYHRNESGIVILRGIVNNPSENLARYEVIFNGNIAIPEGGTPGPIAVSIAINGEPLQTSKAIATPTAADAYFNVTSPAIIDVPKGCCFSISVENVSAAGTDTPAPTINVQNANLTVTAKSL